MDQKTLGCLALAVVTLMGLLLVRGVVTGGIESSVKKSYSGEERSLVDARSALDSGKKTYQSLVGGSTELKAVATSEGWNDELALAEKQLSEAQQVYDSEARPLFEENRKEDSIPLRSKLGEIEKKRNAAKQRIQRVVQRATEVSDFVTNREQHLSTARENATFLQSATFDDVQSLVRQAQVDWPEKKDDLEQRLTTLMSAPARGKGLIEEIDALATKDVSEIQIPELLGRTRELARLRESLPTERTTLTALTGQLYVSFDKILTDMEIKEGAEVAFFHQYKEIRQERDQAPTEAEGWHTVTEAIYKKHEKHLGMTISSKPKGKYDHEAENLTAPPGYSYVGNRHYGQWRRDSSGRSFWHFYGQYAFMRSLFWGPSYGNIYRNDYDSYRSHRSSGRTYYGPREKGRTRYGSSGSYTSSRYASSRYNKNQGYKSTQYKRSGGSYRGSRYSSNRSSSGTSYRRGTRSSGRSRSFGK